MATQESNLFNTIAPVYGLFFDKQRHWFNGVLDRMQPNLDVRDYSTILDVGCGTGALCSVLSDRGMSVTGVDPASAMLRRARSSAENQRVRFLSGNAVAGLGFADQSFDLVIASYVAHGMPQSHRLLMYAEMARLARSRVIICDYNQNRSLLTSLVEWLEQGDYFHFIGHAEREMRDCEVNHRRCFSQVEVFPVGERASWYVCTPDRT